MIFFQAIHSLLGPLAVNKLGLPVLFPISHGGFALTMSYRGHGHNTFDSEVKLFDWHLLFSASTMPSILASRRAATSNQDTTGLASAGFSLRITVVKSLMGPSPVPNWAFRYCKILQQGRIAPGQAIQKRGGQERIGLNGIKPIDPR